MAQKRVTKLAVAAGTGIALVAPAGAAFGINTDNQVNKVNMPTSLTQCRASVDVSAVNKAYEEFKRAQQEADSAAAELATAKAKPEISKPLNEYLAAQAALQNAKAKQEGARKAATKAHEQLQANTLAALNNAVSQLQQAEDNLAKAKQQAEKASETLKAAEANKTAAEEASAKAQAAAPGAEAVAEAKKAADEAAKALDEAQEKANQAKSELDEVTKAADQAKQNVKQAESAKQDADQKAQDAADKVKDKKEALADAQQKLKNVKDVLKNDKALQEAQDKVDAAQQELKAATTTKDATAKDLAAAKEVLKQKQAEAAEKDKAEKQANQVFEDAKTELRKLNQAQLEKQAAYEEAVKAQKEAETNKDNAQNALNEQQPKCDAANKKLDDAKKAKEAADAAVAEAQKAVQAAKDALAASKSKAQEQWNLGSKGFFQENKSSKALAQLNTDFVVNGKKITSYTTIGNPQDATSLENMKLALETMKEGNDLRVKGDNNFAAMPALKVTDELMAIAQINANYSANYDNRHSGNGGPFVKSAGENLSWGGGSPYTRSGFSWYTSEKAIYDKDPSGNSGVVGHYTNLMNKGFLYTGFASGTKNASYGIVHAQEFWGGTTDTEYTYEEYLARFMKYYNGLKDAKENGSQEARDALAKAEANAGLQEKLAKQAEVEQKLQEAIAASEA